MTLTEETGAVPPPSHTWTVPLVKDMLHYARTGLTKAVVMGPCRAVLFYGRQSSGRGPESGQVQGYCIHAYKDGHLGW